MKVHDSRGHDIEIRAVLPHRLEDQGTGMLKCASMLPGEPLGCDAQGKEQQQGEARAQAGERAHPVRPGHCPAQRRPDLGTPEYARKRQFPRPDNPAIRKRVIPLQGHPGTRPIAPDRRVGYSCAPDFGEVSERLKEHAWKVCIR